MKEIILTANMIACLVLSANLAPAEGTGGGQPGATPERPGSGSQGFQGQRPPRPGGGQDLRGQRPRRPGGRDQGRRGRRGRPRPATMRANIYADNWFELYINGKLVAVDSIEFIPHNVISVDIVQEYPMVIAVKAKDYADPKTGLEYNNTRIGDGGFILKFSDGTVTDGTWKAKKVFWGPLEGDLANPKVVYEDIPDNWYAVDFDDSSWPKASVFTQAQVRPNARDFSEYDWSGASFIWTEDLELDNTILFRHTVDGPKGNKE
ncbi:hypothetical protein MYX78_07330 [Acidobacteria bacterium AH-259-G07]|nr:hypothetical protein [Acidobacteria bacterium AH-259-G07]